MDLESRTVSAHCYGHALNLTASGMLKKCAVYICDVDITRIHHNHKYSLRRQGICRRIKDNIPCDTGRIDVRTMCHTSWTIQIDALGSIVSNCIVLQSMWNYAKDVDRARYGDEGKHSRRFVSYIIYEHIPLHVRDHAWRSTAETR